MAALLADDAVWISDGGPDRLAARRLIVGTDRVSRGLVGLVIKYGGQVRMTTNLAHVNGAPAVVVRVDNEIERVIALDIADGRITAVRMILNPDKLRHLVRSLTPGHA